MTATAEPVLGYAILAAYALQRLSEVSIDARHTRRLVDRGGVVVDQGTTAAMVVFHSLWFAAVVAERSLFDARIPPPPMLFAVLAALAPVVALRAWVFATLRSRWTVQVVVVPGETPVALGPYRLLRHPNYLVVSAEVLLLPLLVGAWRTAILGSIAHVPVVLRRVRVEEAAWRERAAVGLDRAPAAPASAAFVSPSRPARAQEGSS